MGWGTGKFPETSGQFHWYCMEPQKRSHTKCNEYYFYFWKVVTVLNEHKLTRMSVFQQNVVFIFHNFSRIIVLKKSYCFFFYGLSFRGRGSGQFFVYHFLIIITYWLIGDISMWLPKHIRKVYALSKKKKEYFVSYLINSEAAYIL